LSTMLCHFSCSITVVVVDYDDVRLILLTVWQHGVWYHLHWEGSVFGDLLGVIMSLWACTRMAICTVVSAFSSIFIEDVAKATEGGLTGLRLFQLYCLPHL